MSTRREVLALSIRVVPLSRCSRGSKLCETTFGIVISRWFPLAYEDYSYSVASLPLGEIVIDTVILPGYTGLQSISDDTCRYRLSHTSSSTTYISESDLSRERWSLVVSPCRYHLVGITLSPVVIPSLKSEMFQRKHDAIRLLWDLVPCRWVSRRYFRNHVDLHYNISRILNLVIWLRESHARDILETSDVARGFFQSHRYNLKMLDVCIVPRDRDRRCKATRTSLKFEML